MNNIKEYIKKSGYKNEFIAQEIGCHHTEISQWIAERRKPSQCMVLEVGDNRRL